MNASSSGSPAAPPAPPTPLAQGAARGHERPTENTTTGTTTGTTTATTTATTTDITSASTRSRQDGRWAPDAAMAAWRAALERGLPIEPCALLLDLDGVVARLEALKRAFPPQTLHAVAIKALPLPQVLRRLVEAGAGLEAASWEEVALGLAAGCDPCRMVYDGPAKTRQELKLALDLGVRINADSLEELERLAALGATGRVGLRVNPLLGAGRIQTTSTATRAGHFGVPVEPRATLLEALRAHRFVDGLHVHVGSQGLALEQLRAGAQALVELRDELGPQRITTLDLGGGLPVRYRPEDASPDAQDWWSALLAIPGLTQSALITEPGRWLFAPHGVVISRVEYARQTPQGRLGVLHVGADLLLRAVYRPEDWWHEVVLFDGDGRPSDRAPCPTTLVGPLCFGGDVPFRDRSLPAVHEGDLALIRDVGAYTLSMWSRHCSRAMPAVIGVWGDEPELLRPRERPEDLVRLWLGQQRP